MWEGGVSRAVMAVDGCREDKSHLAFGVGNKPVWLVGAVEHPQKYHRDHKSNKLATGWSQEGRQNPGKKVVPALCPRGCSPAPASRAASFPLTGISSPCKPRFSSLCSRDAC